MEHTHDTNFVVYVRVDKPHTVPPQARERPLKTCASYSEARRIQQMYRRASRDCVIRYEGITGGGD